MASPKARNRPSSVWRIVSERHATAAFDGEGARRYGGRWNPRGTAVVYTAESLSLSALELLVHSDADLLPSNFVAFEVTIPDTLPIERIELTALPDRWREIPAPLELAALGAAWLSAQKTAVLAVPSAVVPQEGNVLLNPAHPDFAQLSISPPQPFSFDPRLWKESRAPRLPRGGNIRRGGR